MKHAYLIIAHNEFEVLRRLVAALDGGNIDIYIHFDRKVKQIPAITITKSRLYVLEKRIDVKWGTVSQIRCEYELWKAALQNGPYDRYTLLSGTHFPLVPPRERDSWFEAREGVNLFPYMERANDYQIDMKVRRINVKPGSLIWRALLKFQRLLGIRINRDTAFINAGNWASLSDAAVRFLCGNEAGIIRKYRWSFCGDEFFAPTELAAAGYEMEMSRELLRFQMGRSNAGVYTMEDYDELMDSGCLFARKLVGEHMDLVERISGLFND